MLCEFKYLARALAFIREKIPKTLKSKTRKIYVVQKAKYLGQLKQNVYLKQTSSVCMNVILAHFSSAYLPIVSVSIII